MTMTFAAVTSYFNPSNCRDRERCFERFRTELGRQGVELWVAEAALPEQPFRLKPDPRVLQQHLPDDGRLWQKERLLNCLIAQLPHRIQKIAWIDCDVVFGHPRWAEMASHLLDEFPVVQLFDFMQWLGPEGETVPLPRTGNQRPGIAYLHHHAPNLAENFAFGSPGLAWAARREILEKHGLYEFDVTGGGDSVMATAFFGWFEHYHLTSAGCGFEHHARDYAMRLFEDVRSNVGYLRCRLSHLWHGPYEDRNYRQRHEDLGTHGFDPRRHLETDSATQLLRWTTAAAEDLRHSVEIHVGFRKMINGHSI